jgi:hypothetical protein
MAAEVSPEKIAGCKGSSGSIDGGGHVEVNSFEPGDKRGAIYLSHPPEVTTLWP